MKNSLKLSGLSPKSNNCTLFESGNSQFSTHRDTITDVTISQLLMDLLVRLDEFQIKSIYGIMFGLNE